MKRPAQPITSSPNRASNVEAAEEPRLVVVDFFCGAGGITCGALLAGARVACGVDCDSRAKKTYQENNQNGQGPIPFLETRIEDLDSKRLLEYMKPYQASPLLFVGCPPCQPFTNLRTTKEHSSSSKDALRNFVDLVLALSPEFVLIENVPGIRAKKYDNLWTESVERLEAGGYRTRFEIINAARFGVPQKRLRTVLVGALGSQPPWPAATHNPKSYRTVRNAFETPDLLCGEKLCQVRPGERCEHDTQHSAALLSQLNQRRIQAIQKPGGSRKDWPPELELECYKGHDGHTDVYGRMDWEKPSPTLTTRFVSLSNGRFGHPEENRAITPREGALLQTFPPDYKFFDQSRDMNVIHIGNAVPPLLAKAFISAIAEKATDSGDS